MHHQLHVQQFYCKLQQQEYTNHLRFYQEVQCRITELLDRNASGWCTPVVAAAHAIDDASDRKIHCGEYLGKGTCRTTDAIH
jgi:hypothetical protein